MRMKQRKQKRDKDSAELNLRREKSEKVTGR